TPPCPSVVTIHDITFTLRPEWFPWRSRIAFGLFARRSARRAAHVLTVSEASRRDLIGAYGLSPGGVTAIPLAPDAAFSPRGERESVEVARRHGLALPYLIHLGSLHPRRNLPRLLDAMATLPPGVSLALVGRCERPYTSIEPMIRARGLEPRVRHLGYVPEADLPGLVSGAIALVYPSLYEGFGLPVVEAMACGTPVLTSDVSALPETAGGAALLVDPSSTEAIARGISDLIASASLREALREKGLARARDFSWRRTALATLDVYRSALGRAV
ncbi:MAG TPA: glycosyltransferase family 1 protein, partial [Verrucomicrobiae bacterium]|nr:glycosyltransferase family 1 protein [Verrucomicrobiae bacterium]